MSCSSWSSTVLCEKANTDLVIVTDATYSEDTKACGVAAVLLDAESRPRLAMGRQIEACNNEEGELRAILFALEEIPDDNTSILLQSDNKNAVAYLNREARTGENEMRYVRKIWNRIKQKNLTVTFVWQSRSCNEIADAIAAVSTRTTSVWARIQ